MDSSSGVCDRDSVFRKVVVSLTSYPARIPTLHRTIETVLRQTIPPDEVQLWLAHDEFADAGKGVLDALGALEATGRVSVCWREESLRPHNKYFDALQRNADDVVITVDDDILYPPNLIEDLVAEHRRHPSAIVAARTHLVRLDSAGEIAPYATWQLEQTCYLDVPRFDLLATGVGGVLYPLRVFDEAVFDEGAIRASSLLADDLWLQAHELRLGVPVVATLHPYELVYIPGTQEGGLCVQNLDNNRNDIFLAELFGRYPEFHAKLVESARGNAVSPVELEPASDMPAASTAEAGAVEDVVGAALTLSAAETATVSSGGGFLRSLARRIRGKVTRCG